ncbi:MAG: Rnf-Nqr domain containing protein [Chromatiales bacterium]
MAPSLNASCCDGLWRRNPLLVRLLGLCPLLAVSDRLVTALTIGLIMVMALTCTEVLTAGTRYLIPAQARPACQALFAASAVTVMQLLLQAHVPGLAQALGIYVPVVAGCCLLIARAEEFAARQPVAEALLDSLGHGLGILAVLLPLAALREIIGYGSLLRDADLLWPQAGNWPGIGVMAEEWGLAVAAQPAGALLLLGTLLALRNTLVGTRTRPSATLHEQHPARRDLPAA